MKLGHKEPDVVSRKFVISVKDTDGGWTTLTTIEIRVAQPIDVYLDDGVVVITNGEGPASGTSLPLTTEEQYRELLWFIHRLAESRKTGSIKHAIESAVGKPSPDGGKRTALRFFGARR